MKPQFLPLTLGLFLTCLQVCATQWTVSNSPQAPAQFTVLQVAVDSASVGDTLLVSGTGIAYASVIIDKPLVVIGEGYTPASQATMVFEMDIRSSDVFVSGFSSTPNGSNNLGFKLNAFSAPGQALTNVRITRSRVLINFRGSNTIGAGLFSNISVNDCVITHMQFAEWNENRFVFDSLLFTNNIFDYTCRFAPNPNGGFPNDYIGTETIILDHNDFLGIGTTVGGGNGWGAFWTQFIATQGWPQGQMVVSNNIFRGTGPRGCPNCCFINNMTYGAGPEDSDSVAVLVCGDGNYWNVDPQITGGEFNINNDYTLPQGSLAIGAASDGTDIGITGGVSPMDPGERPLGPKVYTSDIVQVAVPPDSAYDFLLTAYSNDTPVVPLVMYEYLFDTDIGVGAGALTQTPPMDIIEILAEGVATGLSLGTHLFGVRARDEQGLWSHARWEPINICDTYGPEASFTTYRSGRTVSFIDKSDYTASVEFDFGDGQSSTVRYPVHTYAGSGLFEARQTATNPCGTDTTYRIVSISGLSAYQPKKASNAGFCTIAGPGSIVQWSSG